MDTFLRQGMLVAVVLLLSASPAQAETPAPSGTAVFAEGRTLTSYFTNGSARERVVQMCVLCMAVALFIMMKKFVPEARRTDRLPARSTTVSLDRLPQSRKE